MSAQNVLALFPLSQPLKDLSDRTADAVVIGTGYGGSIAAYRLPKAGHKVFVFERGKEILPRRWGNPADTAGYPDTLSGVQQQLQVATDEKQFGDPTALFDLRVGQDVNVLVGCGLGGTSLINANVALRADPRVFQQASWPKTFRDDPAILNAWYAEAACCLGATEYPSPERVLPTKYPALHKVAALESAARQTGHPFSWPPINVTFTDNADNIAKVPQQACVLCGDCVTGCNYGSKNTTLMNYLPAAKQAGAWIFNQASVVRIARAGNAWTVYLQDLARKTAVEVTANIVVLAAGTLGSTEILLRSAAAGLPVSKGVGTRFSGNGDALALGYDTNWSEHPTASSLLPVGADHRNPIYGIGAGNLLSPNPPADLAEPSPALRPGPCIAGLIDLREQAPNVASGLVIEEGVIPGAFASVIPPLAFIGDALEANFFEYSDTRLRLEDAQTLGTAVRSDTVNIADHAYRGPVSRMQSYLVMSHDNANGTLTLVNDKIRVAWKGAGGETNFRRDDHVLRDVNQALRGTFLPDPLWSDALGRQIITVHPLGGCPMADTGADGVVNDRGQVFTGESDQVYDGLYVCDGSIIPSALGVNPLLTISALAERMCDLMVKTHRPAQPATSSAPPMEAVTPQPSAALAAVAGSPPSYQKLVAGLMVLLTKAIATEAATDAEAAIERLEASCGPVGSTIRPTLLAEMTDDAVKRLTAEVKATLVEPLVTAALAWLAHQTDPSASSAFVAQCTALIDRFPDTFAPGWSFTETMRGFVSAEPLPHDLAGRASVADPYDVACKYGEAAGTTAAASVTLTVSTPSLNQLATDPLHPATVKGTLTYVPPGAQPPAKSVQVSGTFQLLVRAPNDVETWRMNYRLESVQPGIVLDGFKRLHARPGSNPWTDLTTLYVTLDQPSAPRRLGVLRLGLEDVIAQAYSSQLTPSTLVSILKGALDRYFPTLKPGTTLEQMVDAYFFAKFAGFFGEVVFRAYGGLLTDLSNFPAAENVTRPRRPLGKWVSPPERYPIETAGGTSLLLTRYLPAPPTVSQLVLPPPVPVILAPGFMTAASSFAADTVQKNLVETLVAKGFDVWLLDYSGSPAVVCDRPFTIDDIAQYDWPAAIDFVLAANTAYTQVQVVAHCVGSLSFLMALLRPEAGAPLTKKIASAICSQLTLHPVTDWLNYLKIDLDVLQLIENAGIRRVELRSTPTTSSETLDTFFWNVPVPAGEECTNPLCHRVFSVFGPSYAHAQLNDATHDALCEWFGTVETKPFEQLTKILKKGRAVDAEGRDVYLPNYANLADVPLTFIAGELNQIFRPETSAITLEWLREKNPQGYAAGLYSRHVFPRYAHMDHFIGKTADHDVFRFLVETLRARPPKTTA